MDGSVACSSAAAVLVFDDVKAVVAPTGSLNVPEGSLVPQGADAGQAGPLAHLPVPDVLLS